VEKTKIINHLRNQFGSKHWFICFGTLLYFVRDHIFNTSQDIDIAVIGEIGTIKKNIERTFGVGKFITSDLTGDVLNFSYRFDGVSIDVYQFIKKNGYYWHTYDHTMTNPKGAQTEYLFKGIPVDRIDVDYKIIDNIMCDLKFGRSISRYGTWEHWPLKEPGIENLLFLPYHYGSLLDDFYPDWITRRDNFGTSVCTVKKTIRSCKEL
jgi:hypothetical protein